MRWLPIAAMIVLMADEPKLSEAQSSWVSDRQLAFTLREAGVKQETERAVVWYEAGALTDAAIAEFTKQVDAGIAHIEGYLQLAPRTAKVRYYVSSQVEISHSLGSSVFLPLTRVANRTAPYLHETTHVLAPCRDCPMWFSEGIASFVQSYVSEHLGGYDGVIFARRGNRFIDRDAAHWLAEARGQAVLPFIGRHEEPPDIAYDRSNVAAPYYILSQSLIKHIIEHAGVKAVASVFPAADFEDALSAGTGKSAAGWKQDWMNSLKIVSSAR
jgi:hypothetical protein